MLSSCRSEDPHPFSLLATWMHFLLGMQKVKVQFLALIRTINCKRFFPLFHFGPKMGFMVSKYISWLRSTSPLLFRKVLRRLCNRTCPCGLTHFPFSLVLFGYEALWIVFRISKKLFKMFLFTLRHSFSFNGIFQCCLGKRIPKRLNSSPRNSLRILNVLYFRSAL